MSLKPPSAITSRTSLLSLLLATCLDGLALVALVLVRGTASSWIAPVALHLLAVAAAWVGPQASRSQRALMAALTLTLPVLGAPVAMVAVRTRRRGEVGEVPAREALDARPLTVADVRRLVDGLSASESLMSGSPDEKTATVGMLTRHPDAEAIALLRRAVASGDADLAVEAALALEDLGAQLDVSAAAAHQELDDNPGFERALADADMLAAAVQSRLPDASVIARLVADARRGYERAAALCPRLVGEIAKRRARLELDAQGT
jgi:hypothetical protein